MNTHTLSLKELLNTDYIITDDWKAVEFDCLDDLGFTLDGIHKMSFEYDEKIDGEDKKLKISVFKKPGNKWIVKYKNNKMENVEEREFDKYSDMLDFVHSIFEKY